MGKYHRIIFLIKFIRKQGDYSQCENKNANFMYMLAPIAKQHDTHD